MKKFKFSIRVETILTEEQIWSDGDGPENPKVQDVMNLIDDEGGGLRVLEDWNLANDDDLVVEEVR